MKQLLNLTTIPIAAEEPQGPCDNFYQCNWTIPEMQYWIDHNSPWDIFNLCRIRSMLFLTCNTGKSYGLLTEMSRWCLCFVPVYAHVGGSSGFAGDAFSGLGS